MTFERPYRVMMATDLLEDGLPDELLSVSGTPAFDIRLFEFLTRKCNQAAYEIAVVHFERTSGTVYGYTKTADYLVRLVQTLIPAVFYTLVYHTVREDGDLSLMKEAAEYFDMALPIVKNRMIRQGRSMKQAVNELVRMAVSYATRLRQESADTQCSGSRYPAGPEEKGAFPRGKDSLLGEIKRILKQTSDIDRYVREEFPSSEKPGKERLSEGKGVKYED